jgi:hypothetical protein
MVQKLQVPAVSSEQTEFPIGLAWPAGPKPAGRSQITGPSQQDGDHPSSSTTPPDAVHATG